MLGHFLSRKDRGVIGSWNKEYKFKNNSLVVPLEFNYGCHGYIISRNAAIEIVDKFSPIYCPFDHITGLAEVFGIRRIIVDPPIVLQSSDFVSSIQCHDFKNEDLILFNLKRIMKLYVYNIFLKFAQNKINRYNYL